MKEWDIRQQRYCHSNPVNFGIILIAFFSSIFWWKKVKACLPQHEHFSFFFFFFFFLLLLLLFLIIIMKSKILSYHTRGFSFSSTGYQMVSSLLWYRKYVITLAPAVELSPEPWTADFRTTVKLKRSIFKY